MKASFKRWLSPNEVIEENDADCCQPRVKKTKGKRIE